jgi:hypothetical protein
VSFAESDKAVSSFTLGDASSLGHFLFCVSFVVAGIVLRKSAQSREVMARGDVSAIVSSKPLDTVDIPGRRNL